MTLRAALELLIETLSLASVVAGVYLLAGLGLALIVGGALALLVIEFNDMGRRS